MQKAIYDRFPTITVVNMADVLDTIQSVVDQISLVVRFISGFSILAGAVILASSVAGTRFRRIREVVILKTLGATRQRIAKIFSVEFFVIGTVAGLMGGLLAGGFGWVVLNRLLKPERSRRCPCGVDRRHGAAGDRDRLAGELPDAGAEAAGDSARGIGINNAVRHLLLLAGSAMHLDVTDARGKKAPGVVVEAGAPDGDGWLILSVVKGKDDWVLVWPADGLAKAPDGPAPVPAIVIQRGDRKALANARVVAAMAVPTYWAPQPSTTNLANRVQRVRFGEGICRTGLFPRRFRSGIGWLWENNGGEASDKMAQALKERAAATGTTRMPSEIYMAAMIYGQALLLEGKFDAAAVAFLLASRSGRRRRWRARRARTLCSKAGQTGSR